MTYIKIDIAGLLARLEMSQGELAKAIGYSRAQVNTASRRSQCTTKMIRAIRGFCTQQNINPDPFIIEKDQKPFEINKNVS